MAFAAKNVKPGDLIKSAEWNEIANEIARLGKEKVGAPEIVKDRATIVVQPGPGGNLRVTSDGSSWSLGRFTNPADHKQCCPGRAWGMLAEQESLIFALLKGGRFVFSAPGYNTPRMVIGDDGKVGIGTDKPKAALHVHAPGADVLKITSTDCDGATRMGVDGTGGWIESSEGCKTMRIQVSGEGKNGIVIYPNGNVFVSPPHIKTEPEARLHINGTKDGTSSCGLLLTRDGGGPYLRLKDADGKMVEFQFVNNMLHVSRGDGGPIDKIVLKGTLVVSGAKQFDIKHPAKPGMRLVHACLEGPEAAVFYRGEAKLEDGRAVIVLPDYFEALARRDGRTVHLTPIGPEPFQMSATRVVDGRFTAFGTRPGGEFCWEVKAVRTDIAPTQVERVAEPHEAR